MEEKEERFVKENGKFYQIITIKREISETDIIAFEAEYNKAIVNLTKDRVRLDVLKGVLSDKVE